MIKFLRRLFGCRCHMTILIKQIDKNKALRECYKCGKQATLVTFLTVKKGKLIW